MLSPGFGSLDLDLNLPYLEHFLQDVTKVNAKKQVSVSRSPIMVSENRSLKKLRSMRNIEKYKEPLRGTTVYRIEIRKDIWPLKDF